ncbi:LysM peptidoglycan-binding domain-containing protein [Limibacter armeniacum]|uniref:LysM peptidoglycan-binding domain-containing protein n=1 Tax=Limibacter armeniacum TaxID=466084 RepID=UPI002FE6408B
MMADLNSIIKTLLSFLLFFTFAFGANAQATKHDAQEVRTHQVEQGETLSSISRLYKISLKDLMEANNKVDSYIRIGECLTIPAPKTAQQPTVLIGSMYRKTAEPTNTDKPANGKEQQYHVVKEGENFYQISKQYNISPEELKTSNNLTTDIVLPGQRLIIKSTSASTQKTETAQAVDAPIKHVVTYNEQLDDILRKFKISEEQLRAWNQMAPNAKIFPTQVLIVGYESLQGNNIYQQAALPNDANTAHQQTANPDVYNKTVADLNATEAKENGILIPHAESGKGLVVEIPNSPMSKAIALYKPETVGSFIKVINPTNGKYTAVRVVGALPEHERTNGVIIKLSKPVCESLGLSGQEFNIKTEYNK